MLIFFYNYLYSYACLPLIEFLASPLTIAALPSKKESVKEFKPEESASVGRSPLKQVEMEEAQVSQIDELHTQLSTNNSSPLVSKLKKLLYRRMLIGVNDGRYFLGLFHCIDKQGNIILQEAVEYRITSKSAPGPADQRCLGLILIPSACRSSCHVDCLIEEKMSLMSLS